MVQRLIKSRIHELQRGVVESDRFECRGPQLSILSEDQKEILFNGVLETLQRTGADIHHEGARELLKKHGCTIDGIRAHIPARLVYGTLATLPPTTTICPWDGDDSKKILIERNRTYFGPGPTTPNFIDVETLERRKYVKQDASVVARVCDALPNIEFVQSLGSISDVTNGLADIYEFSEMIQHTSKPIVSWSFSRAGCHDEHRIGIVMAGGEESFERRPNYIHYGEPISPLVSDFHGMDKCMYCAEHRIPQVYSPGTIGGGTAPATHAGQLVVGMSEAMVGVVVSQLISPGTCIIIGGMQSILDMRHSVYSYGAPELSLLSAAMTELCKHVGLPMFSTGGCSDAKVMDPQSAMEAALSINMALLSGGNLVHDCGFIESGMTGSLFQLVMDDEIIGMARAIQRGIEVTEETLALDVIDRVGPGGHYLYEDNTLEWFRSHWRPTLMDRNSYEEWDSDGRLSMRDRIIQKTREIIEQHRGCSAKVPQSARRDIDKILEGAEERVGRETG
jgi:trimethylamine--corrinoid protein Co-methyltransferase